MERLLFATSRQASGLRGSAQLRNAWVCPSCQRRKPFRQTRLSSTATAGWELKTKPYYVTTPIFYVNASPHVGHLYSMVLADVFKRWELLKDKRPALMLTGTDEHGMKVQRAAEAQEVSPKMLCDTNAEIFKDLAAKANISNDFFMRTTDPDHREAVEFFWDKLRDSGLIYETKHQGWYCVSDETFYPESMVEKAHSTMTGRSYIASVETGNEVEWTEEKNYHFRLTAMRDRLLQFYKENPEWVVPATRMAEVVDWVENHLEDLSISRPRTRLEWGIPVPDDPSQTIYVWVDALINYITKAKYPNWTPGQTHDGGWPADLHIVGKDIVRFHAVYWPGLLMALDLPLPKRILSHAHWLMGQRKMSKSIGNVVNPFFALDRWGVDPLRFFLIHAGGIANDSNYSNELIVACYKKLLQGGLGNLLSRVTRGKRWDLPTAIKAVHRRGVDKPLSQVSGITENFPPMERAIVETLERVGEQMDNVLDPRTALQEIAGLIAITNKFFSDTAPWDQSKGLQAEWSKEQLESFQSGQAQNLAFDTLQHSIYLAAESLRLTGILLQPFMPEKAAMMLDQLGVKPARRTLDYARLHADAEYGAPLVDLNAPAARTLFPPLAVEE